MSRFAVGGLFFLYPSGIKGDGAFLGRFVLSLVVSGSLGVGVAFKLGEQSAGRAIFLALAGDILIPGGLFIASMLWGTGCLDLTGGSFLPQSAKVSRPVLGLVLGVRTKGHGDPATSRPSRFEADSRPSARREGRPD